MSSPAAERLSNLEVEVARLRNEVATLSRRIGHGDLATVVDRLAGRVSALDGKHVNACVEDRAAQSVADGADSDAPLVSLADEIVEERVISTIPPPPPPSDADRDMR